MSHKSCCHHGGWKWIAGEVKQKKFVIIYTTDGDKNSADQFYGHLGSATLERAFHKNRKI